MKELTNSQVKSLNKKLFKLNNNLIKNNIIKKDFDDYYEKHKIKAVKDVKYFSDGFVYEDIRCLFNETNGIESNESNEIKFYGVKSMRLNRMKLNLMRLNIMKLDLMKLNLLRLIILILNPMRINFTNIYLMRITV